MLMLTYTNNWRLETNQQPPKLNAFNQLYLLTFTWLALVFILGWEYSGD